MKTGVFVRNALIVGALLAYAVAYVILRESFPEFGELIAFLFTCALVASFFGIVYVVTHFRDLGKLQTYGKIAYWVVAVVAGLGFIAGVILLVYWSLVSLDDVYPTAGLIVRIALFVVLFAARGIYNSSRNSGSAKR